MNKPTLRSVDHYEMFFKYLPQVIKYYTIQGLTYEQIKKTPEFMKTIPSQEGREDLQNMLFQAYEHLIYIWAFQPHINLDNIILELERTNVDEWIGEDSNYDSNQKDALGFIIEILGQERGDFFYDALSHFPDELGLTKVDEGGSLRAMTYGSNSRDRVINYLKELSIRFKNYQQVYQEYYEEDDLITVSGQKTH